MPENTDEKPKLNCRHGWRKAEGSWLPCPFCRSTDAQALQGTTEATEQAPAEQARRKSSAALGVQQPGRVLDLDGKTVAGCAVGKMAADATANTRFHTVMACGHTQIVDGPVLTAADRAGKILKCTACSKVDAKSARDAKVAARKAKRELDNG